jgi:hypothetical protein
MLILKFKGKEHNIAINGPGSLNDYLDKHFAGELNDPKLIYKGKKLNLTDPVQDHLNVPLLLLSSTLQQVSQINQNDQEYQIASLNYKRMLVNPKREHVESFCDNIQALDYPDKHKAMELLNKLRNDTAIRHIMKRRNWRVVTLKELDPSVNSILGYNKNKGQEIALRLRTDDYTGFRIYGSIRQVMLHELAHMVYTDHDNNFNELNSLLNKEYERFTKGAKLSTDKFFQPQGSPDGHVLGGKSSTKSQQELSAEAALRRRELEEMNKKCGS